MKTKRRDLTETTPQRELRLLDEMDRLFDAMTVPTLHPFRDLWSKWMPTEETLDFQMPRVDMIDREDEVLVKAEIPGVDKKDLDVELTGRTLTIRGERRKEEKVEKEDYFHSEIATGTFSRTLRLPEEVDPDKVTAEFDNGLLEIHLTKTHTTPKKRVEVK